MRRLIKHVLQSESACEDLLVAGWIRTRRDSKAFSFIELNDGTCLGNLQIVADVGIPGSGRPPADGHRRVGGG